MRVKTIILKTCLLAAIPLLFFSCTTLTALTGIGGYGNVDLATGGSVTGTATTGFVKGKYSVQLIECIGNSSSQNVTAIMAVTNRGPDAYEYIGGSLDGSVAIDSNGSTSKPYSSVGYQYNLPSGVTVRVEITRIEPVRPGTPMFQSLRITFGTGQGNLVNFRNVPIVWTN